VKATRIYRGDVDDLVLPDHIADWDVHDYWERERFDSMRELLDGTADVLWVVGAEHGYMAALWARLVGSTVLIEPSEYFWPNIRMTWEANELPMPSATIQAFAGADDPADLVAVVNVDSWPPCAASDVECSARPYRYLHDEKHRAEIPTSTIDRAAAGIGAVDAISIDVEGAELSVLTGAQDVLRTARPLVWCSVHPDLMARDYGTTPAQLHAFMEAQRYAATHLATDHEMHYLYEPLP
jgi:FkbM family methyltransferase